MADGFFGRINQFFRPKPIATREKVDEFFDSIVGEAGSDLGKYLLGSGSESLVFKLEHRPDAQERPKTSGIVLKAIVDRTLKHLNEDVPPTLEELKTLTTELELEKAMMEDDYDLLRNAFGDAVPRTRFRVVSVPMTKELIQAHRPEWLNSSQRVPKKIPLLLAVQRRLSWKEDYLKIQGNVNISRDLFLHSTEEEQHKFCEAYHVINEHSADPSREEENSLTVRQMYSEIGLAMDQIKTHEEKGDERLRPAFCEAIKSVITFVNTSKVPVDVMGEKNIVVQKNSDSGDWKLKCPDPLPTEHERLGELENATRALLTGQESQLTRKEKERLAYILNTVLVLNGYAVCLGLPDRVVVPGLENIQPEKWLKSLKISSPTF